MRSIRVRVAAAVAAACAMALLCAQSAQAQTFKVLFNFNGSDGGESSAALIQDAKGNLYGTTGSGGAYNYGTVFKLSKTGQETVLYSFCSQSGCPDGDGPNAGMTQDAMGNLYSTTYFGGAHNAGTVFKLSKTGKETVLHRFTGADGYLPYAGVIRDAERNFYGTTLYGGAFSLGTVYELSKTGKETVLYSFKGYGYGDGERPAAGVILDAKGNLYGTTQGGGLYGWGTVFRLGKTGKFYTLLFNFNGSDGAQPVGGVILEKGNLYGTTYAGGAYNYGTVFELSKTGKETVLYSFPGEATQEGPQAGLIRDAEGNFYGTTEYGGPYQSSGTVFKLTKTDKETVLHTFTGADGAFSYAALIQDAKGDLYGTTSQGGASGSGTVFKLTP